MHCAEGYFWYYWHILFIMNFEYSSWRSFQAKKRPFLLRQLIASSTLKPGRSPPQIANFIPNRQFHPRIVNLKKNEPQMSVLKVWNVSILKSLAQARLNFEFENCFTIFDVIVTYSGTIKCWPILDRNLRCSQLVHTRARNEVEMGFYLGILITEFDLK